MPCLWASVAQLVGRGVGHDHVAQVVVHDHQLEQPDAALVARVVADFAAARRDRTCLPLDVARASAPGRRASSRGGVYSSRHCMHTRRTSRWARIASTVAVIKNVGTPMSFSRVIVLGASFVCSVLNTRCPVSEACTAISAVSRSRISPTRILSGSCRRIDRRQCGERVADVRVDRHLDDAVHVVLDRVLGGDQLVLDVVQLVERRVERRRLARAGRAGDQHDAVGLGDDLAELS